MSGEPLQRSFVGFSRLFLTIARTRVRTKRVHDLVRRRRHFVDSLIESGLISARRSSRTSQLSHELKRRSANLVVSGRWLKVGERLDVAAHRRTPPVQAVVIIRLLRAFCTNRLNATSLQPVIARYQIPFNQHEAVAGLLDDYVLLEPRDLGFVHVLPDLAPKLLDRRVGSVFLELPQHAWANSRNAQNLGVGSCVDVDRYDRRSTRAGTACRRGTRCGG